MNPHSTLVSPLLLNQKVPSFHAQDPQQPSTLLTLRWKLSRPFSSRVPTLKIKVRKRGLPAPPSHLHFRPAPHISLIPFPEFSPDPPRGCIQDSPACPSGLHSAPSPVSLHHNAGTLGACPRGGVSPARTATPTHPSDGAGPPPPSLDHLLRLGPSLLPTTSARRSRGCTPSAKGQVLEFQSCCFAPEGLKERNSATAPQGFPALPPRAAAARAPPAPLPHLRSGRGHGALPG